MPLMQALHDPLKVVLVPVRHQQRFPVRRLDDVLQRIQLPVMNRNDAAGVVIDRAVGKLTEFPGKGSSVGGGDLAIRKVQNELFLHLVVGFTLVGTEIDLVRIGDEFRHLQMVG